MRKFIVIFMFLFVGIIYSQNKEKSISDNLFGIFYEDISYAADGGLYAELLQNRSFEYSPSDKDNWNDESGWHSFTSWEFMTRGFGYGTISIETESPIHRNNPHYVIINVEKPGREGVGLLNHGYDGIPVRKGEKFKFSVFIKSFSEMPLPIEVQLRNEKEEVIGIASISADSDDWKEYGVSLSATEASQVAKLGILIKKPGKLALDMISLFPSETFKNRSNGMRKDLAEVIANLEPKFMRFPGGCVVHGDGLGNMYLWKNTVGPVHERKGQRNLWNYHQSMGIGYYEYFQFCEDIGAKPIPIVPAGVSCQNSGGTWRIEDSGQACLPMDDMDGYIQDVLDLIEYANGPAHSKWGKVRATAGHPEPFGLEYIGLGNEDEISSCFTDRFKMIFRAIKEKYPEIKVIGTVGPGPDGKDFKKGWEIANEMDLVMVDEHYYEKPEWFLDNLNRYDTYNREQAEVYLGEYAAHDSGRKNTLRSALAEAAFMTSLERNGDIVKMVSYAPLLARKDKTMWSPDLIYFTNTEVLRTVNYYVQKLFSTNAGDLYYDDIVSAEIPGDMSFASSVVKNSKKAEVIIKLVNTGNSAINATMNLSYFNIINSKGVKIVLKGKPMAENTFENPDLVIPEVSEIKLNEEFTYSVPENSLTVLRIQTK